MRNGLNSVVIARLGQAAVSIEVEADDTVKAILNMVGTGPLFGGDEDQSVADVRESLTDIEIRINGVPSTLRSIPVDGGLITLVPKVDGGQN